MCMSNVHLQYDRFLRWEKRFSPSEVDMDEKTFMYEEVLMFIVYTITSLGRRGQKLGHGFQHHARYLLISMTSSLAKDFRYTSYMRRVVYRKVPLPSEDVSMIEALDFILI